MADENIFGTDPTLELQPESVTPAAPGTLQLPLDYRPPAKKLDRAAVYAAAKAGFATPKDEEGFNLFVHQKEYGQPSSATWPQISEAVYGRVLSSAEGTSQILRRYEKTEAANTPESLALKQRVEAGRDALPESLHSKVSLAVARGRRDDLAFYESDPVYGDKVAQLAPALAQLYKMPVGPINEIERYLALPLAHGTLSMGKGMFAALQFFGRAMKGAFDPNNVLGQRDPDEVATDSENYQAEKNQRAADAALNEKWVSHSLVGGAVQGASGFGSMALLSAVQPELAAPLALSFVSDLRNTLRDKHGLTETQADMAVVPAMWAYTVGLGYVFKYGGSAGEKMASEYASKFFGKLGGQYAARTAATDVGLTMLSAANAGTEAAANVAFGKGATAGEARDQFLASFGPNFALSLLLAAPELASRNKAGDPSMLSDAHIEARKIGVDPEAKSEHPESTVEEHQAKVKEIVEGVKSIIAEVKPEHDAELKTATAIIEHTKQHSGGTFDVDGNSLMPDKGYAVGAAKNDFDKVSVDDPQAALKLADIRRRLHEQFPDANLGTWIQSGSSEIAVDPALHIMDHETALRLGAENGQKAIFDYATGQSEDVPQSYKDEAAAKASEKSAESGQGPTPETPEKPKKPITKAMQRAKDQIAALREQVRTGKATVRQDELEKLRLEIEQVTAQDVKPGTPMKNMVRFVFKYARNTKQFPLERIAESAIDAKDKRMESVAQPARLASYRADMIQINRAIDLLERDPKGNRLEARGIINDVFGSAAGKVVVREFHAAHEHSALDQVKSIRAELEARAKDIMGPNIIKVFGKGRLALTADMRAALDKLAEEYQPGLDKSADDAGITKGNFNFAIKQMQALANAAAKIKASDVALEKAGKISPGELDKRREALSNRRHFVEKHIESLPIEAVNKLHDRMVKIVMGSRNELQQHVLAKDRAAEVAAPVAISEIARSVKRPQYSGEHGEKLLSHAHVGAGDMVDRLGGLHNRVESVTRKILHTDIFEGRNQADLANERIRAALDKAETSNGITPTKRDLYRRDFRDVEFANGTVNLSTAQMMDLLASTMRESTLTELARADAVYGQHEVDFNKSGWQADRDRDPENPDAADQSVQDFIATLKQELTPAQQKCVADSVKALNDAELSDASNAATIYHTGLPQHRVDEVYYPRYRKGDAENPIAHLEGGSLSDIFSGAKPTQSNRRPLIARDFFSVTRKSVRDSSLYAYVTPAVTAAEHLLARPDVKGAINSAASKEAVRRLYEAYRDVEGQSVQPRKNQVVRFLEQAQTLKALWFNVTGAVDVRMYHTGMAAAKIAAEDGAWAASEFLGRNILSSGPKRFHPADWAKMDAAKQVNGFLASRYADETATAAETLVEAVSPRAEGDTGPARLVALKKAKQLINNKGLAIYRNGEQKTVVQLVEYGQRKGMTLKEATDFAVDHLRAWGSPSSGFDYTRQYRAFLPYRLANPFTGATSRIAATGSQAVEMWRQAETPAEKTAAFNNLKYHALGLIISGIVGGAARQAVWARMTGQPFNPDKDDPKKHHHPILDAALNTLRSVDPALARATQLLVGGWNRGDDPFSVTTVQGMHDAMSGAKVLFRAARDDGRIDWSKAQNQEAAVRAADGVASAVKIQTHGLVRSFDLIVGQTE